MAGAGKKEISSNYCPNVVKIVLKRCPRTEKAVQELFLQNNGKNCDHPCPICGLAKKVNGSQNFSLVQVDLFKNLVWVLTLEAGGSSSSGGDDILAVDQEEEEDVQKFGCEECLAKFDMLESLQNEISLLEDKMEEILDQLRKTIRDRRGLIAQPGLTAAVTEAESIIQPPPLGDMDEKDGFETFTQITAAAENEEFGMDLKPLILDFQNDVHDDEQLMKLPEYDNFGQDPLGEVDSVYQEQCPINNLDLGYGDDAGGNKSRRCKIPATQVILPNDDNVHDDNDDYVENIESSTDNTSDLELESGIPLQPLTKVEKEDEKHICDVQTHGFSCETCHETFSREDVLITHRKMVHLKQSNFMCEKCRKGFPSLSRLNFHMNRCIPCADLLKKRRKVFDSETSLQHHLDHYHPGEEENGKISCTICNKEFATVQQKLAHIKANHHTCIFCDNSFSTKAELDEHKETTHTGDHPYLCTKCGKRFSRDFSLRTHLQLTICNPDKDEMDKARELRNKYRKDWIARKKSSQLRCELCLKTFLRKDNLILHKSKCRGDKQRRILHTTGDKRRRTLHTGGNKLYFCTKCGNKFSGEASLRTHLQITTCNPDKDDMIRAKELRKKKRREWLAKRKSSQFQCEFCIKTFVLKDNLILHISKCHRDVKSE